MDRITSHLYASTSTPWWYNIPEIPLHKFQECMAPVKTEMSKMKSTTSDGDCDPFFRSAMSGVVSVATKVLAMKIGEFHEHITGCISGYENLPVGHDSECDTRKVDGSEIFELKNRYNTMNSSSAKTVVEKLSRHANTPGITTSALVIINRNGNSPLSRFKAPEEVKVWDGQQYYTHITGSDTFFQRLQETFAYSVSNAEA
tara:strand:- start:460 stop:1062 length:603 start_codon:yes stop_codon:yes gene_type:complete